MLFYFIIGIKYLFSLLNLLCIFQGQKAGFVTQIPGIPLIRNLPRNFGGIPTTIAAQRFQLPFSQQNKLLGNPHLLSNSHFPNHHVFPRKPIPRQPVPFSVDLQHRKRLGNQNQGKIILSVLVIKFTKCRCNVLKYVQFKKQSLN